MLHMSADVFKKNVVPILMIGRIEAMAGSVVISFMVTQCTNRCLLSLDYYFILLYYFLLFHLKKLIRICFDNYN